MYHDRNAQRRTFDRIARRYDRHAALEQEVGQRLLERLGFQRLQPQRIVDLGCGTGQSSAALKKRFRKAQVIGLDSSTAMLTQMRMRSGLLKPLRPVCADFSELPLAQRSVELVFSNLAFQFDTDPNALFAEIRRVLAPAGMLLFSSLGPASLREIATAWLATDDDASARGFADILDVGNALVAAGFQEPVMDAERITLSYPDIESLVAELEATGAAEFFRGNRSLQESKRQIESEYRQWMVDGRYPVTYELIYGVAFGPPEGQPRKTAEGDVVSFSVDSLRRSGRPLGSGGRGKSKNS